MFKFIALRNENLCEHDEIHKLTERDEQNLMAYHAKYVMVFAICVPLNSIFLYARDLYAQETI